MRHFCRFTIREPVLTFSVLLASAILTNCT